jgi:hypothetical protein
MANRERRAGALGTKKPGVSAASPKAKGAKQSHAPDQRPAALSTSRSTGGNPDCNLIIRTCVVVIWEGSGDGVGADDDTISIQAAERPDQLEKCVRPARGVDGGNGIN